MMDTMKIDDGVQESQKFDAYGQPLPPLRTRYTGLEIGSRYTYPVRTHSDGTFWAVVCIGLAVWAWCLWAWIGGGA